MRKILEEYIEKYRIVGGASQPGSGAYGAFKAWCPVMDRYLNIMAFDGRLEPGIPEDHPARAWEHVSVSALFTPTWNEMCWVKDAFWEDEEFVLQFHPPKSEYVNVHGRCLHLWRPIPGRIEMSKLLSRDDSDPAFFFLWDLPRPPKVAV